MALDLATESAEKPYQKQRPCTPARLTNQETIAGDLCGCRVFPDLSRIVRDGFAATSQMRSGDTLVVP